MKAFMRLGIVGGVVTVWFLGIAFVLLTYRPDPPLAALALWLGACCGIETGQHLLGFIDWIVIKLGGKP